MGQQKLPRRAEDLQKTKEMDFEVRTPEVGGAFPGIENMYIDKCG